MTKVKKVKELSIELYKYTSFSFAYVENAQNVGISLAQAGYFINIIRGGNGITLDVYSRSPLPKKSKK